MRNTRQKNVIFEIVNNSYDHLNAYQIYDEARTIIPNISLGTVYRNLSCLFAEGEIRKFEVNDVLRFDRKVKHSHFICNKCDSVIDVFDSNIIRDGEYIAGNLVMDYEILFRGICKKCMEGNGN